MDPYLLIQEKKNSIEWIFDTYQKNPIMTKEISEINNYISKYNLKPNIFHTE